MNNSLLNTNDAKERDAIYEMLKEPLEYIEHALYIKTKDQQIKPLWMNDAQQIIYGKIQTLGKDGKPIRIIILKARQEGVSTLCEAILFEKAARHENVNSLIIAHEPESTEEIFAMSKRFYDMLPEWMKPMRRYDNKKQMVFENPNEKARGNLPGKRSRMIIATADKARIGRGMTLHCFHGSEVAFWKKAKELMLSVMQAIPDLPNTMVFLESTANGFGGDGEYFYNIVQDSIAGKNDFELIFTMLGERATTEIHRNEDSQGVNKLKADAHAGGSIAGNARKALEKRLKRPIVSKHNYLKEKESQKKIK